MAAWTNAALLTVLLHRRGYLSFDARLKRRAPRIVLASALMAAALFVAAPLVAPLLSATLVVKVAALAALIGGGVVVYGLAVLATRAATLADMRAALSRS